MAQFLSWSLLNDVVHQINHPCAFPKIPFIPHKRRPNITERGNTQSLLHFIS